MTSEEAIYFGRRIENKSIKQNGGREHMFTTFITKVSSIKDVDMVWIRKYRQIIIIV